jgi:hypothetical protein
MLLIKLYLWALLRGVKNVFQFRFFFNFLDSLRYFLPAFVAYQIWPSSCGFRDIMGLRGVKRDFFFLLKGELATILTKKIMFWKLVNSFKMMK